jgi:predicted PurR-regulated permease PerM
VLRVLAEVARALGAWIRGQLKVALWMIVLYAAGFALIGVPFWPVIAIVCGSLHVVPMVGAVLGLLIPVGATLVAGGGGYKILAIVGVFVCAQALESFYLTPRILGSHLRLRPVVVFFALFAGGLLFGFLGAVFAVPAVAIAVLIWRLHYRPHQGGAR